MWRKYIRPALSLSILVATVAIFIDYFMTHKSVRSALTHLPLPTLLLLVLIYFGTILALALVNSSTLRLCQIKASATESVLITAYTAVVNFFGPLQSGPAVRAVYLKKRYQLNLKKYTLATLVYYFFWAAYSGLFLLSGLLKWWLVPLALASLVALFGLLRTPRLKDKLAQLDLKAWYFLALASFLQISLVTVIYFIELHLVAPGTHFNQAIIYTGAANFALFVSITPGAIGFRESFLVFSRHLHHISSASIVAANIIDRSVYIIVLVILAVFIAMTHAGRYLGVKRS